MIRQAWTNAVSNGFENTLAELSDEGVAQDMWDYDGDIGAFDIAVVTAAVREVREALRAAG